MSWCLYGGMDCADVRWVIDPPVLRCWVDDSVYEL